MVYSSTKTGIVASSTVYQSKNATLQSAYEGVIITPPLSSEKVRIPCFPYDPKDSLATNH